MTVQPETPQPNLVARKLALPSPRERYTLNLTANPGEIIAILGKPGVGKTALLNLLAGFTPLSPEATGSLNIAGTDLSTLKPNQLPKLRKQHCSFLPQSPVFLATHLNDAVREYAKAAGQTPTNFLETALTRLKLKRLKNAALKQLSPAELKLIACAAATATASQLLYAVEPTAGLGTEDSTNVFGLFKSLAAIQNTTVVFTTSDPALAAHAQQVIVLTENSLICYPSPVSVSELREECYPALSFTLAEDELAWLPRPAEVAELLEYVTLPVEKPAQPKHSKVKKTLAKPGAVAEEIDLSLLDQLAPAPQPQLVVEPVPAAEPSYAPVPLPTKEPVQVSADVTEPAPLPGESLEETLQRLAPTREFDPETAHLLDEAQRILSSLPGTVAPRPVWAEADILEDSEHV